MDLVGEGGLDVSIYDSTWKQIESFNHDIEFVPTSEEAKGMGDTSLFDSEYRETKYSFTKGPSQVRIGLDSGHHEKPGNQSNKYLKRWYHA